MANSITSELVIKLQDDLSAPAGKAAGALRNIEKEEARLAAQSKTLEAATRQLSSMGRLDAKLERTRERLAAEEAAVKRLSEAMTKVEKPTKKMVEAMLKAEATVKLTNEAIDQQKRKIDKAGEAFEKLAGAPFTNLASAEARLRGQIEETTSAIRRQADASTQTRETEERNLRRRQAVAHSFKETMSTLGMLGGPETLQATREAAKAGADVQHTRVEMAKSGMSPGMIAATEAQAYKLSAQVRTVSPAEVMEIAKEARSVLTDPNDLAKVLPTLTKAKSVLDARDPGGEQTQSLAMLVKGAENIGAAKDPARLNKLIDGAVKAMQVMGKTIDAEQFYAFLKNSRLAGAQLSDRFIMTTGMSLLQEMGGQTAGKAANEMESELIGGLEHKNVAVRALKKLKLIDPRDVAYSKTGEVTGIKRGKLHVVHGDEKLAHDPDKWVYEDLLPAMRAAGITKVEDQLAMARQIFSGSKTAQDLVGKLITQQESYAAHAAMYPQAAGVEGYKQNADDPLAAMKGLTTQFESFAGALTSPVMKEAGHVLDSLAGKLGDMANGLHDFADKHPDMAAILGGGALAGGALAGGKLTYGLFSKMFGGSAELKGSAAALTTSADAGLKAAEMLMVAAERLGAPKSPGGATPGEKATPSAEAPAEPGAAAEAAPKPTSAFGAGGLKGALKSVPKAVVGAGPEAVAEYYGYKFATEGIDGGLDALPFKKNSESTQSHLGGRGVTGTLSDLWHHLRGQDTPEEAAKKAAGVPIAGARATGGPVASGKTYLVGERGPELFTPGASGAISSNEDAQGMLSTPPGASIEPAGVITAIAGAAGAIVHSVETMDRDVVAALAQVGRVGEHRGSRSITEAPTRLGVHPIAGARATGGPVGAGRTYLVGERGPELFTAGAGGQITSHERLMNALGDPAGLSTADVQRVLAGAGRSRMDAETAKAVREFGFDLSRAVDNVADSVDRLDGRALWGKPGGGDGGGATPFVQGGSGRGQGGSTGSGEGRNGSDGGTPDSAAAQSPLARAGVSDRPVESGLDAFNLYGAKHRGEGIRPIDPNAFQPSPDAARMPDAGKADPGSVRGTLFSGESGGKAGIYNYYDGGRLRVGHFDPNKATIGDITAAQRSGKMFATGLYQVIPKTLSGATKALHLKDSDPYNVETQNRIFTDYLAGSKRPQIGAYIRGEGSIDAANLAMAREWASVADPHTGRSYYPNDRASISADRAQTALRGARGIYEDLVKKGTDSKTAMRAALLGVRDAATAGANPSSVGAFGLGGFNAPRQPAIGGATPEGPIAAPVTPRETAPAEVAARGANDRGPGTPLEIAAAQAGKGASFPGHIGGQLKIDGESFKFGSGGVHGSSSIPFGDYPIALNAPGAWGKLHGAMGLNNNQIWDNALHRMRTGILMHVGHSANLITEGCLAFEASQFNKLKSKVAKMIGQDGHAYLHVGKDGASITSEKDVEAADGRPRADPLDIRKPLSGTDHAASHDVHAGLQGLHGGRITPAVDNSHLEHTAGLLDRIHGRMKDIHSMSASAQRGGGSQMRVGALNARARGGFASAGSGFG